MGHDLTGQDGDLSLDELVSEVVDTRRLIAALQAKEATLLARAVDVVAVRTEERRRRGAGRRGDADLPLRDVSAELALAMRLSDRAVQGRMGDAATLENRFAATLEAWSTGRIDAAHVAAILDAGASVREEEPRGAFEQRVLVIAETESPARLRAAARAIAAEVDPLGMAERATRAKDDRRVRVVDLGDGMARVNADVPATLAEAILDRLTQMARAVRDGNEALDATKLPADDSRAPDVVTGPSVRPSNTPTGAETRAGDDEDQAQDQDSAEAEIVPDSRTIDQLRAVPSGQRAGDPPPF